MISLQQLQSLVSHGEIDTVVIALTDMQGRLMGKHVTADFFMGEVVPHGAEGCNYLLAVDTDMRTVGGYALSSWASGYGDFVMKPDLATLRLAPWLEKTVLVQCDLEDHAGIGVLPSPRQILKAQLERLHARGLTAISSRSITTTWITQSSEAREPSQ